jgi:hypothetical protein
MAAEAAGARVMAAPHVPSATSRSPGFASFKEWGRLSWRKTKYFNNLTGGADGTRTRDPRRDRRVSTLASMSEKVRIPHELAIYLFSFTFARTRFWWDIRRTLDG